MMVPGVTGRLVFSFVDDILSLQEFWEQPGLITALGILPFIPGGLKKLQEVIDRIPPEKIAGVKAKLGEFWKEELGSVGSQSAMNGERIRQANEALNAPKGLGGRILSTAEKAEFSAFATRARAAGLTENQKRFGSWGKMVDGKFKEVARIDVAEIGEAGWRGKTHMHIDGLRGHLPLNTPIPGQ